MKKSVEFKLCGKEAKLEFNIMRLAKFEKALGQSLFYIMKKDAEFVREQVGLKFLVLVLLIQRY